MGKIILDAKKLDEAASKFRAIAHPMRMTIIQMLDNEKQLNVTQIYTKLGIEQAAASHHLSILKTYNVLESKRSGKMIYYTLKHSTINSLKECIDKCGK